MNINTLHKLSYGLYVVTTWVDGKPTGCTANAAMQITAQPATLAISINHDNYTNQCIKDTGIFALNILGESSDPAIIGNFGFRSGRDCDKFEGKKPIIKDYLPIVDGAMAYITCKVVDKMEASTHTVFLAEIVGADILNHNDQPMTYAYYHNVIKGKSPKNAPTYIGD